MYRLPCSLFRGGPRNYHEAFAIRMQVEILKYRCQLNGRRRPLARLTGNKRIAADSIVGHHNVTFHALEEKLPPVSRPDRKTAGRSRDLPFAATLQAFRKRPHEYLVTSGIGGGVSDPMPVG